MEQVVKSLVSVTRLTKSFGGLVAVDDVTFDVERGSLVSIIGPNGAGKTTLINLIAGAFPPTSGSIILDGRRLDGLSAYHAARMGVARTFQLQKLFNNMTVLENVMVGRHTRGRSGLVSCTVGTPGARAEHKRIMSEAREYLAAVGLQDKENELPSLLPVGQQKLVEIARALAVEPSVLILDEPAGGLAAHERQQLVKLIDSLRKSKELTILLIEHDMGLVMTVSDKIIVLVHGRKIAEGRPEEIRRDRNVIDAYLGDDE